jgi:glucan phosphoethanolaminetransferase (alkaline phosphatase superfamily)
MATNIIRWIIAVPAGLLAWFGVNYSIGVTFGFAHGFEVIDEFWEAPDMNGMPISGTYIILITRIVAAAALVVVIVYLVPRYHKRVAIVVASLVSAVAVSFLCFVLFQAGSADLNIGPDGWYRHILDMLSIILGAIFGAWMAYGNQKRRAHA